MSAKRKGRRVVFVPAAWVRTRLWASEKRTDIEVSDDQCVQLMRDLFATRQWGMILGFYDTNREGCRDWPFMVAHTLIAALIYIDECELLDNILQDARAIGSNQFYFATYAALAYRDPADIERLPTVRGLLRGEQREPWVCALFDRRAVDAVIDILDHVNLEHMTTEERRPYVRALIIKKRLDDADRILDAYSDDYCSVLLARRRRQFMKASDVHMRMMESSDERQREQAKSLFWVRDVSFAKFWKFDDTVRFRDLFRAVIGVTLMILFTPYYIVHPILTWLFRALSWGWSFVFVRLP